MWMQLPIACLAAVLLMFVPGYLLLRALRCSVIVSLCSAPIVSVGLYALLPIAYYAFGVSCGWVTVALPVVMACAAAYVIALLRTGDGVDNVSPCGLDDVQLGGRRLGYDATMAFLYVAIALIVCLFVFVGNLPHADAFYSRFDNQTHLNLVQAFLDSGKWSTLHTSVYLASAPAQAPVTNAVGGFYPAAWHVLVALVCNVTGATVAVGTNACVIAVCVAVLPLCMYLFVRVLFPHDRLAVGLGALVTSASAAYPWVFVVKGPTWPDLLGNSLLPAVFAVVMLFVEHSLIKRNRLAFATFVACSFVGIALIHPSGVFTAYVFFAAYGLHVLLAYSREWQRRMRMLAAALYCLAIVVVWVLCYQMPPLQGILGYWHSGSGRMLQAIVTLCALSFALVREQPVLVVGLLVGAVACIRTRRFWLLLAPAFFGICYVVSFTNNEILKYWLAAFWYMTEYRFTSRIMLFCIPLISWGFAVLGRWLRCVLSARLSSTSRVVPRAILAAALVLCCFVNYWPRSLYDRTRLYHSDEDLVLQNDAAYGRIWRRVHNAYADDIEHVYSTEEVQFVNEAMTLIPRGALVINSPRDGSMWAYGINQLNAYYRKQSPSDETKESKLIRKHLNKLASSKKVRKAVQKTGAQYVLLLDKDVSYEDGVWLDQFHKKYEGLWQGIDSVDDDTPGFEVVLAKGDQMRLYRIVV